MSTKIQIKSDLVGTFGGIFLMLDHFNTASLDKLVDKLLENRRFNAKYSYSDIFKTLLATYATNGSCIEDSRRISGQISEKSQDNRLCSPDILLNSFNELVSWGIMFRPQRLGLTESSARVTDNTLLVTSKNSTKTRNK